MTARAVTLNGTSYPLVLPSIRDPRLHVASVIITIHVLGQTGLHFAVTVPQILAAILACAVIEVALTFRSTRSFVWPASAMLTGSGVALIMRVVGTPRDDPWNPYAWYVFAGVAAFSLLTKYVIKYKGTHVFNPSNIGLVVAFVLLGSSRIEPLDFWWGPLDAWLAAAYAVIIIGGVLITRRLHLLALGTAFWLTLAAGLGLLAASGHCMTANWAFAPVCGFDFWRVIVTSPEVLIFLFFMITDPKTVPMGQVGRVAFGVLVGVASVLLMAPQTDEFGTKVGLLAGLVVICAARPIVDRLVPEPRSGADDLRAWSGRLVGSATSIGVAVLVLVLVSGGILVAGTPARGDVVPDVGEVLVRSPGAIDPATLPAISVEQDALEFDHQLAGSKIQQIVVTLGQNLEVENRALQHQDDTLLTAVDHGDRLAEMRTRLADAKAGKPMVLEHFHFDTIDVSLLIPFGQQTGLSLGLTGRGTKVQETYDASGNLVSRASMPFANTFAVRQATGTRWLNVGVLPPAR